MILKFVRGTDSRTNEEKFLIVDRDGKGYGVFPLLPEWRNDFFPSDRLESYVQVTIIDGPDGMPTITDPRVITDPKVIAGENW